MGCTHLSPQGEETITRGHVSLSYRVTSEIKLGEAVT